MNKAHEHIKKHLSKGHNLDFVKLRLLEHGEHNIEKSVRSYLIKHHFAKPLLYSILPLIILTLLLMKPATIGFVAKEVTYNHTDQLNLALTGNTEYSLDLVEGNLTSLQLSGTISKTGRAKVYLWHNTQLYLIFDNSQLAAALTPITGLAVSNNGNETNQTNKTNETNQTVINETDQTINITKTNQTISINLAYAAATE